VRRRAFLLLPFVGIAWAQPEPRVIPIVARKFEFEPAQVTLKLGEPVVFELTTADVHMGFDAFGLGLHADIVPGKPVRVPFTPSKVGEFDFVCDVFCGSGHEDMGGVIKVLA
jgi:cytochrome c oxidase subunit 2